MPVAGVDGELRSLGIALGLLDAAGELRPEWFGDPIAHVKRILVDPEQRSALLDAIEALLPPDDDGSDGDEETRHPLLEDDGPAQLFLTVARSDAGDAVLGIAGSVHVDAPEGQTAPAVDLALRAGLVHASDGGLTSVVGTPSAPLRVDVDVLLDPTGAIGFEGVRASASLAPLAAGGPSADVAIAVRGLRSSGRVIPITVIDPEHLGEDAFSLLAALLQHRLDELVSGPNTPPELVALAHHLLPLIGLGDGLPSLAIDQVGHDADILRAWLARLIDDTLDDGRRAIDVWLGHLAGLLGSAAPAGGGTEADPWAVRLAAIGTAGGVDLTLAIQQSASSAAKELLVGLRVDIDSADAGARGHAGAVLAALPLSGTSAPRPLPSASVSVRAPREPDADLVSTSTVTIGFLQAGVRWDGAALRPTLELGRVTLDGKTYDVVDLSNVDSARAAVAAAARDAIAAALGAEGPGRHLAVLAGLAAPADDPGAPLADPVALISAPTRELARLHRQLLLDATRGWQHMLGELAALLGFADSIAGTGTVDDPWRVSLADAGGGGVTLDLVAWNPTADRAGAPGLRVGLGAHAAHPPLDADWRVAMLSFDLPADAPATVRLLGAQLARIAIAGPLATPPALGLEIAIQSAEGRMTWEPGQPVAATLRVEGISVFGAGVAVSLPVLSLPPPGGFDPAKPDLGLDLPVADLVAIVRALLSRLTLSWGGTPGFTLAGLIGLHRQLPGLPDDWPLIELPAGQGLDVLLHDPVAAIRAWVESIVTGVSADGTPFAAHALAWLRSMLEGALRDVDAFHLAAPDIDIEGNGSYDDPWLLGLTDTGRAQLVAWLEPDGPPAAWATALRDADPASATAETVLELGARATAFASSLRGSLGEANAQALITTLAAVAAELDAGDGVVPLSSQLPVAPGWTFGATLVDAAHHLLPAHPDAIAQVLDQLDEWAPAASRAAVFVGPPFADRRSWLSLLDAAEGRAPHSTDPAAHFDLRQAPDPSLADLRAVRARVGHYTADLADPDGELAPVIAQIAAVVGRVRELRGDAPVALVAHSTAGVAARAFAAANPTLVRGLITLGTPHGPAPLTVLQDADAADALRVAARLLAAGGTTAGSLADAVRHLMDAAEGWHVDGDGAPPTPLRYPIARFAGAPSAELGGVPGLALAGRLADELTSAATTAIRAVAETSSGRGAPTHVAFGVRAGLTPSAPVAGGIAVDVGVRIDAFRLGLSAGAAEPVRAAHRLDVNVRIARPGGWLLEPAPDDCVRARVRHAELGLTIEPDSTAPSGRRATPRARLYEAGLRGPSLALVDLAQPVVDGLLDAIVRELGTAAQATGTSAAALLDGLDALGLIVRDASGAPGLSADALGALRADAATYLAPRLRSALARPAGLLGVSGAPDGPWTVSVPGAPVALSLTSRPWRLTLATAADDGVDLGAGFRLNGTCELTIPEFRTSVSGHLTQGDATLSWDSGAGTLVLTPAMWAGAVQLLPISETRADGRPDPQRALALLDAMLSAAVSSALEGALGPGWNVGSLVALIRTRGRRLLSSDALGDGGELDGARVAALLRAMATAAGLPASEGLALPGGFLVAAAGKPCTVTLTTDPPIDIAGPEPGTGGHFLIDLSATIDRLLHVTPGGHIELDVALGGDWGGATVALGLDGSAVSLVVTPRPPDGGPALAPIVLLPHFGGLGPLAASAAQALLPAVLDALVAQLPSLGPARDSAATLGAAALEVADALGIHGGPGDPSFAAHVAQLRALTEPEALATLSTERLPSAIAAVWTAAGLPGTVSAAGAGVAWQATVAGAAATMTVGWGAAPAVAVAVDGLVAGPMRVARLGAGVASGTPSGELRLAVELPQEAQEALGLQLAPELSLALAGDTLSAVFAPLGAGSASALAIELLPVPGVTVGPGGIAALIEQWAVPLAATAALSAFDVASAHVWENGPTVGDVLTSAGLLADGRVAVPLPEPLDLVLGALARLASEGRKLKITETLDLQLVVDATQPPALLGVGLHGHVDVRTDTVVASVRFGESQPTWIPDPAPALRLLLLEQSTLHVRPQLRLAPLGLRLEGPDGKALLDSASVHVGAVAAYGWVDLNLDGGVRADHLGGALDLRDLGLPLGAASGQSGDPDTANPVAASMLGSDKDKPEPADGDQQALDPGLGLVAAARPGETFSLVRIEGDQPVPFDEHPLWFGIHRTFGPISIEQVGFAFDSTAPKAVAVLVDGGVRIAGLTVQAHELGVAAPLAHLAEPAHWRLDLRGLAVGLKAGPVSLAGGLIKRPGPPIDYAGIVNVEVAGKGFSAVGAYARPSDELGAFTSLFVFVALPFVIGGPPYLFVTGLGGGAGYNRRLVAPTQITDVPKFALVTAIDGGLGADPMEALAGLGTAMPPRRGSLWLAAGVRFTSFALVRTVAVAYVALDRGLEIGILGVSGAQLPDAENALASVELAIKARFSTAEGVLSVQAQLTDNSWLLSKDCQITGGFAFFIWFHRDQFVLTVGGYHPAFAKPPEFPVVPRLGFRWAVSDNVVIKGESYFALTASCVMAGGRLEAAYQGGPVRASFVVYADFLISWDPFHYDISAGVTVSVSLRLRVCFFACVTIEVGLSISASVHILGPPLHGEATLDLEVCSVTVEFGADEAPPPTFIDWDAFRAKYVIAGAEDGSSVSAHAGQGLLIPDAPPGTARPGASVQSAWRFVGDFSLHTETRMPATAYSFPGKVIQPGLSDPDGVAVPERLDLAPMNVAAVRPSHDVVLTFATGTPVDQANVERLVVSATIGHVPAAPWILTDHPVAGAAVVPALTGLTISGASAPEMNDPSQPALPPIPISTLIDWSEAALGLNEATDSVPRERASALLHASAGAQARELVAAAASLLGAEGTDARAAAALPPAPVSALSVRALRHQRSSPPLVAALATGFGEPPTPGARARGSRLAAAAPIRAARVEPPPPGPQLRAILRATGPATPGAVAAPRTTAFKAGEGLPRTRPDARHPLGRPLRRHGHPAVAPATSAADRGRTLRSARLGSVTPGASRLADAAHRVANGGIVIPAGSLQVWDLPSVGADGAFVLSGAAAARATFLDRAGAPVTDVEAVPGEELRLIPPPTASRLAVGCLGMVPDGIAVEPGPGAVSLAASLPGRPAACGWQDGGLLAQVAPAALLARGASLRLAGPLRSTRRSSQRTAQTLVTAVEALAQQPAAETALPAAIDVVIVIVDARGAGVPAAAPRIAVRGATLAAPPLVVTGGRRMHLFYTVTARDPDEPPVRVAVAGAAHWQLAGVVGVNGRADDWADALTASTPRQLVADGPLTTTGEIRLRHETTQERP